MGAVAAGVTVRVSAPAGSDLAFHEQPADIWKWQTEVAGSGATRVTVNGNEVPIVLDRGRFQVDVTLQPGVNQVRAYDAAGRSRLLTLTCRLSADPTAASIVSLTTDTIVFSGSPSAPNPSTQAPLVDFRWTEDKTTLATTPDLRIHPPWIDGEHFVELVVTDAQGHAATSAAAYVVEDGNPALPDMAHWHPGWVDQAVVYGVVPPLFGSPAFASVTAHLGELAALGVTVLWLAPVFTNVPGDYGYEVIDYFSIRPDWGTLEDLQELVDRAHALGMRVILDFPANDTSKRHPYFQQAQRFGTESHYYNFYQRRKDGTPVHYFDWTWLPNLSYDDFEVSTMVIEASLYWLDQLGIDGYRVDAAWGVRRRQPGFWPVWRAALKNANPDILLLAEGSARDTWWASNGFDVAYDWTESLGQWAWHAVFDEPSHVVHRMKAALSMTEGTIPFRFLDNNDTGERFIAAHGVGMTKAATAVLLTLPGVPELFTGSEIGAVYQPYRRTAPLDLTDDPYMLRPFHRQLISLRRSIPQLTGSGFRIVEAEPAESVIAYQRWDRETGPVSVTVNFSDQLVDVHGPAWSGALEPWGYRIA